MVAFIPAVVFLAFWSAVLSVFLAIFFRIVVSTNDVHIVQSAKRTVSYGKDQAAGNVYYRWPAWVPRLGVKTIVLSVSVFNVNLDAYAAYDVGRVPFIIDVMAFFRIDDSNVAAQRVHSFVELQGQLKGILQGAIRSILASAEIETILQGRAEFGAKFTEAVEAQLKAWGVTNVKNIELMDIRDADKSDVIHNIMAKKQSLIERQSRVAVADNLRAAQEAEIIAKRQVGIAAQEAEQRVGERTAEKEKQVGLAQQLAQQAVKLEEKETATRIMAVRQVNEVRHAEIERDVNVVDADRDRKMAVIKAEGDKQQVSLVAEGNLYAAQQHAQGVEVEGKARGEAEKAVLLAPVVAQITLAEKIAALPVYQTYLVSVREIEKNQVVGIAQAEALKAAQIKVIANTGTPVEGVKDVMDLFTSKGGTQLASMVEAMAQTPTGEKITEALLGKERGKELPNGGL